MWLAEAVNALAGSDASGDNSSQPQSGAIRSVAHVARFFGILPSGAEGSRTPDLRIANATLSQLSYRPKFCLVYVSYPGLSRMAAGSQETSVASVAA